MVESVCELPPLESHPMEAFLPSLLSSPLPIIIISRERRRELSLIGIMQPRVNRPREGGVVSAETGEGRQGGHLTFRGGPISHDIPLLLLLLLPKCTMSARAGCARLSDVSAKDSASCCNCAHHRCLCNIYSREREQAEGKVGKLEN